MKLATVFFIITMALVTPAISQQKTLFEGDLESGGFGGPVVKFTQIQKEFGVLVGGYGGWLINHQLMIGGGGYGLVTDHAVSKEAMDYYGFTRTRYLELGYGGGMLEYIYKPNDLLHASLNILIGAGGVTYRESRYDWEGSSSYGRADAFFVLEPTINAELNVSSWMRFDIGGSYRLVTGINELVGVTNSDLSGPSGSITLKFGSF